jgi:hypothetical protein
MHFDPSEIRHGEHFGEQRAHIVEMRENAFGIGVAFATENFVDVDGEAVEKILLLGRGFLDETRNPALTASSFPGFTLKYGCRLTKFESVLMSGTYVS